MQKSCLIDQELNEFGLEIMRTMRNLESSFAQNAMEIMSAI